MASETERSNGRWMDRRGFFELGVKTAAAVVAIPAASAWLTGCGSGEESAPTKPPSSPPPEPAAPAPPPKAEAPAPPPPAEPTPADGDAGGPLVTDIPEVAAMVASLQYVNASEKADQNCTNCLFFEAQENGLGKCELFALGLVKEGGWCASWSEQVTGS